MKSQKTLLSVIWGWPLQSAGHLVEDERALSDWTIHHSARRNWFPWNRNGSRHSPSDRRPKGNCCPGNALATKKIDRLQKKMKTKVAEEDAVDGRSEKAKKIKMGADGVLQWWWTLMSMETQPEIELMDWWISHSHHLFLIFTAFQKGSSPSKKNDMALPY